MELTEILDLGIFAGHPKCLPLLVPPTLFMVTVNRKGEVVTRSQVNNMDGGWMMTTLLVVC